MLSIKNSYEREFKSQEILTEPKLKEAFIKPLSLYPR